MPNNAELKQMLPGLIKESSDHITKLASENLALLDDNEALKQEVRALKLAHVMQERGLEPSLSYEEKVASLLALPRPKLAAVEAGLEFSAGGFSIGHVAAPADNDESRAAKIAGATYSPKPGEDLLDNFVLNLSGMGHGNLA